MDTWTYVYTFKWQSLTVSFVYKWSIHTHAHTRTTLRHTLHTQAHQTTHTIYVRMYLPQYGHVVCIQASTHLSCDLFLMRILGRGGVLMGEEGIPEWMFDVELARGECVTERELVWKEESVLTAAGRTGPA